MGATDERVISLWTKVTNAGILSLAEHCPNITTIYFEPTKVTDVGIQSLAEHCPNIMTIDEYGDQLDYEGEPQRGCVSWGTEGDKDDY